MPTLTSLSDDFEDGVVNSSAWDVLGTVTESGGKVRIAGTTSVYAVSSYLRSKGLNNVTPGTLVVKADMASSALPIVRFGSDADPDAYFEFLKLSSSSLAWRLIDGTSAFGMLTYSTQDPWWKFEVKSDNTLTVSTSADAQTWIIRLNSKDLSYASTNIAFNRNAMSVFFMGAGDPSTTEARFESVNPSQKTQVVASAATATASAPGPEVRSVLMAAVDAPGASSSAFLAPAFDLHDSTAIEAPSASVTVLANPPQNQTITFAAAGTSTAYAVAPTINIVLNTIVYAEQATAFAQVLPPGEYVRISAPAARLHGAASNPRRTGPALSEYAASVMQTPQNYGGALAFYRLSDATDTLTDVSGLYHGAWHGTHALEAGAISNDSDASTFFDGQTTQAVVGLLPPLNQPADDPRTLSGNTDPFGSSPYYSGASVELWFKITPGSTKPQYLVARNFDFSPGNDTVSLRLLNGGVTARVRDGNDLYDLSSTRTVNDGQWHQVVLTQGRDLTDETANGMSSLRLYVDGQLDNQRTAAPDASWHNDTWIGAFGSTTFFEGNIDDVSFYDLALTRWQVLEHYNQALALSGPPLRIEPIGPATSNWEAPQPTIRKSPIRPLNDFYDDFDGTSLDRSLWRDASPDVLVNDALFLRTTGERVLTQDYYQAKDSTLIVRIDQLPLAKGTLQILLVNENDIIPASLEDFDSFRRHRDIGFEINRFQEAGRTKTFLNFVAHGQSMEGTNRRSSSIEYVPDDPNFPSPMKWLKLEIDGGVAGGATWSTSPDGTTWTERYDVHGGQVNAITEVDPVNGTESVTYVYEDPSSFRLFDEDINYPVETQWRGHMRVLIQASGNSAAGAWAKIDNVNVLPQGTGTDIEVSAKPALAVTTSSTDYLMYTLNPMIYSSATDVAVEAVLAKVTALMPAPPEPVYVFTQPAQALSDMLQIQRGGDALPIAISAETAIVSVAAPSPSYAGQARPVYVESIFPATAFFIGHAPSISTDESRPAPVRVRPTRQLTVTKRPVLITISQN